MQNKNKFLNHFLLLLCVFLLFSVYLVPPKKGHFPLLLATAVDGTQKMNLFSPKMEGIPLLLALALTTGAALQRERKLSAPSLPLQD
jgi:hypothetical protein